MMPKLINKSLSLFLSALICVGLLLPVAVLAQDETTDEPSAAETTDRSEGEQREIIRSTLTFFGTIADPSNLFSPFDDFFSQNQCKRRDIFALIQKRDQAAILIRKAILDHRTSYNDILKLQGRYELISAEIYYLRNVELLNEFNGPTNLAYRTNNEYESEAVAAAIPEWERKYTAKLPGYLKCESTWSDLGKAWDKMLTESGTAVKNLSDAWDRARKAALETPGVLYDNTTQTFSDFWNVLTQIPDLFDDETSEIASGSVKLGFQFELNQRKPYEAISRNNPFQYRESAAAQTLARNPNATIPDLVESAIAGDTNATGLQQNYLNEAKITAMATSLDGTRNDLWLHTARYNAEFAQIIDLTNPDAKIDASISSRLENIIDLQCREGV